MRPPGPGLARDPAAPRRRGCGPFALIAFRLVLRRSRRYVRLRLIPYRSEEAQPQEVLRMIESWHQQVLERWWRRALFGQRGMALEIVTAPDAGGDLAGTLSIVSPRHLLDAVEGTLIGCYPNTQVEVESALPPMRRIVRLKKRYRFTARCAPERDDRHDPIDSLLGRWPRSAAVRDPVRADAGVGALRSLLALAIPLPSASASARAARRRRPRHPLRGLAAGARGRPARPAPPAVLRRDPRRGGATPSVHGDRRDAARRVGRREPARRAPHARCADRSTCAGCAARRRQPAAVLASRGVLSSSSSPASGTCPARS